jgi:hypothetical protein
MSLGTLERVAVGGRQVDAEYVAGDWETPAGAPDSGARARLEAPTLTYYGLGEEHWRGQKCHPIDEPGTDLEERVVIMACGCRASVPWWTLEPCS